MVKGVSILFRSYDETIPKILNLIKFNNELKKHEKIVLKPGIKNAEDSVKIDFVESVLKYCIENRSPGAKIFIAEGFDGDDTMDIFSARGYRGLSEKYGVGLIDLNKAETEEIEDPGFLRFDHIMYPKILKDSFVVSLSNLSNDENEKFVGSLGNMIGAFPSKHYMGFFSAEKNKIKKHALKYQIHDINKCKIPDLSILDSSGNGRIFAGQALEIDKQAARSLGINWKEIGHLKLIDESFSSGDRG